MQKISRKYSNKEYAPGLALYGVDGKDGVSGEAGRSLFVCQYDIDSDYGASEFGNAINQNLDMTANDNSVIGRPYMNGDVFLMTTGYLYRIDNLETISTLGSQLTSSKFKECMTVVGTINISSASEIFSENTNRLVLDTEHYKGFIINMSSVGDSDLGTINSPFTIISDKQTGDNKIYFLGLKSIYAGSSDAQLNIYYDTANNAYVINSDKDILIDADVRISSSNDINVYDEFSKPLLSDKEVSITSFGSLCSHLTWNLNSTVYDIYNPDENVKYTNEIYNDDAHTILNYKLKLNNDKWGYENDEYYSIRQFDLTESDTDYVYICAYRVYSNPLDNKNFDLVYGFNDDFISLPNILSKVGIKVTRPISSTGNPNAMKWCQRWWEEVKGSDVPTGIQAWNTQVFCPLKTQKIFIPSGMKKLIVSTLKDESIYVMVFSDGKIPLKVDNTKEQYKIDTLRGGSDQPETIIYENTGYDVLKFMSPRYKRTFKIVNNANSQYYKSDVMKTASLHFIGVSNKGNMSGQRLMEYYVRNSIPSPDEQSKDVILYGDYPEDGIDWYVSVISDNYTEFFIQKI